MSDAGTAPNEVSAPRRAWPVHPFLLALVPTLTLFSSNLTLLPGGLLWRPLVASVAFAGVLWALGRLVFRSWEAGAVFASLFICGFAMYSRVLPLLELSPGLGAASGYCAVLIVLSGLGAWKVKATALFNFFSLALVLLFAGRICVGLVQTGSELRNAQLNVKTGTGRLPDVYYVILDGQGREDVLREDYGISTNTLAEGLRERGFFVADKAHSNYVQTELSLASSLNASHLKNLIDGDPGENNRLPFDQAIRSSSVQKTFKSMGYELVAVTTGFPAISFPQARTGYAVKTGLSLLETALIQSTPIAENGFVTQSQFASRRNWLLNAFNSIQDMAGDTAKPKMVVAHILAPHPPFVFGPNGEPLQQGRFFGYNDGSDYFDQKLSKDDYKSGYAGQAQYMAKLTLKMVDTLIARSKTPPIIIIQGDHGPKSRLDQNELAKTDIDECFPILNAYYGPEALKAKLYPSVTPVNSFRLVLSTLTGQEQPTLPDRSYYSPFGRPMQLTDITDKLKR